MEVHCDEGVAAHIGPKPCAGIREDVGEASAGERAGQPLSWQNSADAPPLSRPLASWGTTHFGSPRDHRPRAKQKPAPKAGWAVIPGE